jgi:hypothetical protein
MTRIGGGHGRGLLLALAAALGAVALGGTALAGHSGSDVKSYTGCLTMSGGTLTLIREGNAPLSECSKNQVEAHFSGGDITKISVTGALNGGGDDGEVTIGLKPEFTLPTGCASGQVAKWNGTGWTCAADNDTTYSAGTGLALSGGQFSVAPDYKVKNTPDCASGQFATGFDSSGDIECASPPATTAYFKHLSTAPVFKTSSRTAISLWLPAGAYVVTATATAHDDDANETTVNCDLYAGGVRVGGSEFWGDDIVDSGSPDSTAQGTIAVTAAATLASDGTVELKCDSTRGNDSLSDVAMTAIATASIIAQ